MTCLDELPTDDYWVRALQRGPHLTLASEGFGEKEDCERKYNEELERLKKRFEENVDFFPWKKSMRLHKMEEEERQIEVRDKKSRRPLDDIDRFSILFKDFGRKNIFLWRIYAKPDSEALKYVRENAGERQEESIK